MSTSASAPPSSQHNKVWFITGTSTGFGRLLAEHLIAQGACVVATARDREKIRDLENRAPAQVQALTLDVTKPEQVKHAVADALTRFGHVDVLVNNAGYGLTGAIEEVTEDEFRPMLETNVFGLLRVTKALLPQFRERRSGHILQISSIAGLVGSPGWGYYNATKFAVEGLSDALYEELKPLGVHVTVIEPGPFRTDFLGRSGVEAYHQIPDYAETAGKTREYFHTQPGKQAGDPQKAVEAMIAVVESNNPPRHLLLGRFAHDRLDWKLKYLAEERAAWQETTLSADFPAGQ